MDDLVTCPHCNGSGKVRSSESLRAEVDTLMRKAHAAGTRSRSRHEREVALQLIYEALGRYEEVKDELRLRADRALARV